MAGIDQSDASKQRVIRVFVSSTFRDMQAEREELVKKIFPRLRKLCEQRGVIWGEVDLRWGITDEQKAEGKVLPICLAEIEHCRPYFIGILGERYGWTDNQIPAEVVEQYGWLKDYAGRSVTEIEIFHGVFRDKNMNGHAFFYFRDPAYCNSLSPELLCDYTEAATEVEIKKFGLEEAKRLADERKTKLAALKQSIKGSGFPYRENYQNPKVMGELVYNDLKNVIDKLYPEGEQLDTLDQARYEHEAYAESRFNSYIPRKEDCEKLNVHVNSNGLPIVIKGESGSGKSALLANWAKTYKKTHTDNTCLLFHFIGATPDSTDWMSMLRRIMEELKRKFGIQEDIPEKPEALKKAFTNWLYLAAAKGKIILVIDALNRLEDRDGALELTWLPESIPSNVRLIVSSLPGKQIDTLTKRGWTILEVKDLTLEERENLIYQYLAQYGKKLPENVKKYIASHNQTRNPLYLRSLLEEIRLYGDHFTINKRIDHYLSALTIDELFIKILERYEQDYNDERKDLVKDTFSCIYVARKGLSESELRDILGSADQPLPAALWSPLFISAERSLINRAGLLNFNHDYFRKAIRSKYLITKEEERRYHLLIADYFKERELSTRKVDEYPWHLARAACWERLSNLLADPQFFIKAWYLNQFDVKSYWALIEQNSQIKMVQAYRSQISIPSQNDMTFIFLLSRLLGDTGHASEALSLYSYLIDSYTKDHNLPNLGACLGNKASLLRARGDLDGAMKLYKKNELICLELNNLDGLQRSLGNQALILYTWGDLDGAMKLQKEKEKICRELNNFHGLQISLGNQAVILKARGDLDGAMKLQKEKEKICREVNNPESLQTCLGNQALILRSRGDLDGAMKLLKEQEQICRELHNPDGIQRSLGNQAIILRDRGDLDGAMKLHKEQERLYSELNNPEALIGKMGNQALILRSRGDLDGAMRLLKEVEQICRKLNNIDGLMRSLGNQAGTLQMMGDLDGAMKLHKEEERICRELNNPDALLRSLGNQALILAAGGNLDAAMRLHKEEERICRELANPSLLQVSLGNQAGILRSKRDLGGAMKLLKEQELICRDLNNLDGLQASLGNQALILREWGDPEAAMKLHKEEEQICRQLGNNQGLAIALLNQSFIFADLNRPCDALPLAENALKIAESHRFWSMVQRMRPIVESIREKCSSVNMQKSASRINIPEDNKKPPWKFW